MQYTQRFAFWFRTGRLARAGRFKGQPMVGGPVGRAKAGTKSTQKLKEPKPGDLQSKH